MKTSARLHSHSRAFTLVEIMVSTVLFGLVATGIARVFIQCLDTYAYDVGKLLVNRDIRAFTSEMTENATYSNYYKIFPAYNSLTRNVSTLINPVDPELGYTTAMTDTSVNDGASGDCLVFVYKDTNDDKKIARIIGYFRAPDVPTDPNSTGPVRKFIVEVPPSSASLPVWQLIPNITNPTLYPSVLELSRGLSNGKLFYNFCDRSVIIKGEIIHRGGLTQRAINTYNFTVSPRG
jgi:prepilin-type N-terminal cleavage/methylation domain-containing protein